MGLLTIDTLMKRSVGEVVLPMLSAREGSEQTLRFRWISEADHLSFLPMSPPGAHAWIDWKAIAALPEGERPAALDKAQAEANERGQRWFDGLPVDVQERRVAKSRDVAFAVIAYASLEPKLTIEEARALGPDAPVAYQAILAASGLARPIESAKPEEKTEAAPAELRAA